jgi:hypothetical protein
MEKLNPAYASALVTEAIKSGAIKLRGPARSGQVSDAIDDAAIDAAYILKLITDLTEGQQQPS